MNELIAAFSQQLKEALTIGSQVTFSAGNFMPKQVIISGMGGSGIGGTIIQNYAASRVNIPVIVNKSYQLPAFADPHSLVIISSYSGNTEETINALEEAIRLNCRIVCITSGGSIAQLASQHQLDCILIPGGRQPRACLGYSMVQLLFVLAGYGLIDYGFEQEIQAAVQLLENHEQAIQNEAKELASWMKGKIPLLYVGDTMQGVAVRWCQQINENGKSLCWHNTIPEMNHNEIEGWEAKREDIAVLFIHNPLDHERVQLRMEVVRQIVSGQTTQVRDLHAEGACYLERALYLIHVGDWVSWYLSLAKEVNANEVKMIDYLKSALTS